MKLLLLIFALTTGAVAAQASERTLRILYLDAPSTAPRELILFDGKEGQKVKLPKMNFSPVYNLRAGVKTIALLETAPESAEDVPPEAPRVSIPDAATDFYLFISTDTDNPIVPVRMSLVQTEQGFKTGQMLWFNLTETTIGGEIGGERIVIRPNSRHLMNAPVRESSNYPVKLVYQVADKERLHPICETQWFHNPNSRNVAFVFPRPGLQTPRVMVFPDYR